MRHLIILDFRAEEEFALAHIRKSMRVDLQTYGKTLVTAMLQTKSEFKSHYEGDDLRRVLFVFSNETASKLEKELSAELQNLSDSMFSSSQGFVQLHKAFWLKDFPVF